MTPIIVRLRFFRERAGLSQYRLARLADVPQSTISRIEAGVTPAIDLRQLERLADVLEVKRPGDLLVRVAKHHRSRSR
jgi:transcriptional regulator with XRE-family HTH domain